MTKCVFNMFYLKMTAYIIYWEEGLIFPTGPGRLMSLMSLAE